MSMAASVVHGATHGTSPGRAGALASAVRIAVASLAPRQASGDAAIPVRKRELTPAWLTSALCGHVPGAQVESFSVRDVSRGTSTRWRITPRYNEAGEVAGLPVTVFAKATSSLPQRITLTLAGILEPEAIFINHLREGIDAEIPHGYHGAADPRTGRSLSLMEDLTTTKHATFLHADHQVSKPEITGLLETMARWHAHYWESDRLDGLAAIRTPRTHAARFDAMVSMRARSRVGARRAARVIPEQIISSHDQLYDAMLDSLRAASTGPGQTLLHGDPHIGNTYTTPTGAMGFCDWQLIMRGHWAFDVSYIIASSLTVEQRRAWEHELLDHYLDHLAACGVSRPSTGDAVAAYRGQLLYPYFIWALTLGRTAIQPRFQPDALCRLILGRTAQAIFDHHHI